MTDFAQESARIRLILGTLDEEYQRVRALAAAQEPFPLTAGLQFRNRVPSPSLPYATNPELHMADLMPQPGVLNEQLITDLMVAAGGSDFTLRILIGQFAPAWLMDLCGTFQYTHPQPPHTTVTMLRYWTVPGILATSDMFTKIARAFPELPGIWATGGMTFFAEPMLRGFADDSTRQAYIAAGFTVQKDADALSEAVGCMAAFRRTRVAVALNAYQRLTDTAWVADIGMTANFADDFRDACGPGAILGQNSLRSAFLPNMDTANGGVYRLMLDREGPLRVQTAMATLVGDLYAVSEWAVLHGFHALELPQGWEKLITPEQAASLHAGLKANA